MTAIVVEVREAILMMERYVEGELRVEGVLLGNEMLTLGRWGAGRGCFVGDDDNDYGGFKLVVDMDDGDEAVEVEIRRWKMISET